jgi:flagellin-like hook-associated protein FlgL
MRAPLWLAQANTACNQKGSSTMSDITLSAGVRQTLLSLQNTAADLNTTQEDLSTGKKVNTAFDNPTSYFTSQSLTNRANDLSALLDQIGQAQQTLNAANNGLTGLTSLLEQALSTAQQAQQASNDTAGSTTGSVNLTGNTLAAGNLLIASGGTTYTVAITSSATVSSIEAAINGTSGLGSSGAVTATDDGSGHLILTANSPSTTFTVSGAEQSAFGLASSAVSGTSSTRTTLQSNYNALLTQIDQLAGDSSYNGVNLLNGNNLTVNFNETGTSSLTITGVNFNHTGLGLTTIASGGFQSDTTITSAETAINAAISTARAQTETFGANSSTISTRQTFEQNMINTLQTGAGNLVLADQNQESANLLTLQTQQQLEISALSIANQANQSVLKLFG